MRVRGQITSAVTAVAALLALAAACRQIVGIGDEPPTNLTDAGTVKADAGADAGGETGGEAGPACGIAYAPTSCEVCLESNCCRPAKACAGGTACSALEVCLGACAGDVTCRATCVEEHRVGADPLEIALGACLAGACAKPCGISCGGFAQGFGPDAAASCESCITQNDCSLGTACGTDPACLSIAWCRLTNPWGDRYQACRASFLDAGHDAWTALDRGLLSACGTDCAMHRQWDCVGSSSMATLATSSSLVGSLVDGLDQSKPTADAAVTACSVLDPSCTSALSSGTTDADGSVTLALPAPVTGTSVTGYFSITGSDLLPELYFWGFPLSEPTFAFTVPTMSTADRDAVTSLIASLDGGSFDLSSHALIAINVTDCTGMTAEGVQIAVSPSDPETRVFYFSGSGISATADSTDPTGSAIVVNVPAGTVTLTVTPKDLGKPSSVSQLFTRAGTITSLAQPPNQ